MRHIIQFEIKGSRDRAALVAAALATFLMNLDGSPHLEGFIKEDFVELSIEEKGKVNEIN